MTLRIGILGAGGWGTALAVCLHRNGHAVDLWEYVPEYAEFLDRNRENRDFLPGVPIPSAVRIGSALEPVLSGKDLLLVTLPSHAVRSVAAQAAALHADLHGALVVSASKGIENGSLLRMSEVWREAVPGLPPERVVALSGPSHAEEVGRGIPTVVVAASPSEDAGRRVQEVFMSPAFRVYTSRDVVGVELGGSLKNVIAIAAGISDGIGFGDNTKAAILTRGLAEMARLGAALGARPETFSGLSGMGDLIVTCTSRHSRNRFVGEQIGRGKTLDEVLAGMKMVAEGVRTARSAHDLARRTGMEMPITTEVFRMLFEGKDPRRAVTDLMTRNPRAEG